MSFSSNPLAGLGGDDSDDDNSYNTAAGLDFSHLNNTGRLKLAGSNGAVDNSDDDGMSESDDDDDGDYGTGVMSSGVTTTAADVDTITKLNRKIAQLTELLDRQRGKTRSQTSEIEDLTEKKDSLETEQKELQMKNDKNERMIKDLQFALRRAEAKVRSGQLDFNDIDKVKVRERIQEFQARIAINQLSEIRQRPGQARVLTRKKRGDGGDFFDSDEEDDEEGAARGEIGEADAIEQLYALQEQFATLQAANETLISEHKVEVEDFNAQIETLSQRTLEFETEIEKLISEKRLDHEKLRAEKDARTIEEARYQSLIRKLARKNAEDCARLRAQYRLDPSKLPRLHPEAAARMSGATVDAVVKAAVAAHKGPALVHRGVVQRISVNNHGHPIAKRQYGALFSIGAGTVHFKWASQECGFSDYSHSATVIGSHYGSGAISKLRSLGPSGLLLTALIPAEDEARFILLETKEKRYVMLVALSTDQFTNWQKAFNVSQTLSQSTPELVKMTHRVSTIGPVAAAEAAAAAAAAMAALGTINDDDEEEDEDDDEGSLIHSVSSAADSSHNPHTNSNLFNSLTASDLTVEDGDEDMVGLTFANNALNSASEAVTARATIVPFNEPYKTTLIKFKKGGKDYHPKRFCINPNGLIQWGDSDTKYKYQELMKSVRRGADDEFNISKAKDIKPELVFTIGTTGKPLCLVAPDSVTLNVWIDAIAQAIRNSK